MADDDGRRPPRPARRADPRLPAVLLVLLEPAGAHQALRGAGHRRLAPGARRGRRPRRAAEPLLGRRAAAAPRPRRPGRARELARDVHEPRHQRDRPLAPARAGAARGRPRPRAGQHPGRRARALRPPRRHLVVRQEDRGRPAGQGAGLAADPQRGAAPPEHRPRRGHPRLGRGARGRPRRARQHPVLRLGAGQPVRAAAEPRAARARGEGHPRVPRATARTAPTSSTSSPTTTAATPSPAWAAGATASS